MNSFLKNKFTLIREHLGFDGEESRLAKTQFILTVLMQLVFIGAIVWAIFEPLWEVIFVSILAMVSIWLPLIFAKKQVIHIPIEFVFLFTLFIYGALFLGEIQGFYTRFWWWDIILHTGSGLALGFIGFLILYYFYITDRLKIGHGLLCFFSFTFALALGTIWEIFEFAMDNVFGFNMQKSGLVDTMWDLIVDAVGALVASITGYFYLRGQEKGTGLFKHYLKVFLTKNKINK